VLGAGGARETGGASLSATLGAGYLAGGPPLRFCKGGEQGSCCFCSRPNDHCAPLVDSHSAGFAVSITAKAAPTPLLWFGDQPALHRIAVHITQLLDALALAPHIEIIEAVLPDMLNSLTEQLLLRRCSAPANLSQEPSCETLLQRLHHFRWVAFFRLTDQKVNMLGHHHVPYDHATISLADLFENA
jgi:hypothetical protein